MTLFRVKARVLATADYEMVIDRQTEAEAQRVVAAEWRDRVPDDFAAGEHVVGVETEVLQQLSWSCDECSRMITEAEAGSFDGMCRGCYEDAGIPRKGPCRA